MLKTADWTIPTIGGFLSESIEKEARHLDKIPAPFSVQNVWDPSALRGRPTEWKEVQPRQLGANAIHVARGKLGMNSPTMPTDGDNIPCRSNMLASRRTADRLAAMKRDHTMEPPSITGKRPMASLLTPTDLQQLTPSYSQNETCATETTNQLIGLGSTRVPVPGPSRYNRASCFPSDFVEANNSPNRLLVERARMESKSRRYLDGALLPLPQSHSANFSHLCSSLAFPPRHLP